MEKPKISAVLIVKNEEECLARCLESVKDAYEIIICDTGSIDKTIEVAKKYTDKVYTDFVWCDSFEKARNHALSKATGDYVLSIDADEYLHSWFEVEQAVKLAQEKGSLAVDVMLYAEDNNQGHYFPRLFKRDPKVFWCGAIHNHLSVLGDRLGDVKITYGYSPAHKLDPDRAMRILEKEVKANPEAVREMFYLGREYFYRNRFEECLLITGKYVQKSVFLAEKAEAFLMMARAYWALKMAEDARDACLQALKINSHFKEAILFFAVLAGEGTGNEGWERNAKQWRKMSETADNQGVLFVRA